MEDDESEWGTANVYRDGKVHVLSEECATCIFRPHERFVDGARVAGMVADTKDTDGSTVICHSTLYSEPQENAICRGWFDRLGKRDSIITFAEASGMIAEQAPPEKTI